MSPTRFADFSFHSATRELRRGQQQIPITAQAAQVLSLLLDNSGKPVSREALRKALWPEGTHVDHDAGINFCIAQLRQALGDSAEQPRFIKTLPKQGFMFIPPQRANWPRRALMAGAGASLMAGAWVAFRPTPVRIAVARFENQSGDAALDSFATGLADVITVELAAALPSRFSVIGNATILRDVRKRQDLDRVGQELKAAYVVIGQVQRDGAAGRVLVHLIRLPDQGHLAVTRVENPDFSQSVALQSAIAKQVVAKFRPKLGG